MQRELVYRHLQGTSQAEAELQGEGAPVAPKPGLTPPYSERSARLAHSFGERERSNVGQLPDTEAKPASTRNRVGLTIECSPRTSGRCALAATRARARAKLTSTAPTRHPKPTQQEPSGGVEPAVRSSRSLLRARRSPRTQAPRLEIGENGPIPTDLEGSRSADLQNSWKGEIMPGFLYLGDRMTASDMDRLATMEV